MTELLSDNLSAVVWSQLWQVTVLIVVVAVVARLAARNRPHLAHVLWLIVLLKCVTPPWLASPGGLFSQAEAWLARQGTAEVTGAAATMPAVTVEFGDCPMTAGELPVMAPCFVAIEDACWSWTTWAVFTLVAVWLLGTAWALARSAGRYRRFGRLIRRPARGDFESFDTRFAQLASRLGVRRAVRLRITASRVGPAVVGWFRPVIVLPELLVRGRSPSELAPILAHELVHLRRGDTWIGLLRAAVQTVWWFHPLVGWVGRVVSREAERCCDEAVVAELGLRPADYARCLLGVLERKNLLTEPVPAFPGVRPVEVTSKRMERIMRLGQGCRRRSPWWCYVVMVAAAAAVLPGAAWVAAEQEEPTPRPGAELPPVPTPRRPLAQDDGFWNEPSEAFLKAKAEGKLVTVRYLDVADVLAKMSKVLGIGEHQAKEKLIGALAEPVADEVEQFNKERAFWSKDEPGELVAAQTEKAFARVDKTLQEIRNSDAKRWPGGLVIVPAPVPKALVPSAGQGSARRAKARPHGLAPASIEMASNTSQLVAADLKIPQMQVNNPAVATVVPLGPNLVQIAGKAPGVTQVNLWLEDKTARTIDVVVVEGATKANSVPGRLLYNDPNDKEAVSVVVPRGAIAPASASIEGAVQQIQLAVCCMEARSNKIDPEWVGKGHLLLDSDDAEAKLQQLREKTKAKVLARPTMVTIDGRPGSFCVGSKVPLVAGYRGDEPDVKYVWCGTSCDLQPALQDDGHIRVKARLRVSKLRGMKTETIKHPKSGEPVEFENPVIDTREVETVVEVQPGQTAVILVPKSETRPDDFGRLIFAVSPTLPEKTSEIPTPETAGAPRRRR